MVEIKKYELKKSLIILILKVLFYINKIFIENFILLIYQ